MNRRERSATSCVVRYPLAVPLSLALAVAATGQDPVVDPDGPARSQPPAFQRLEPSGLQLRVDAVEDCDAVSVWIAFGRGSAHDPADVPGLAVALAELLRGALPAPTAARPTNVAVLPGATMLGATVPVAELERTLQRFRSLLAGQQEFDDAALEQARDRALLRLDDERHVLPGPVLRGLAAAAMRSGDPALRQPDPEALADLPLEELRAGMREMLAPQRALLAVLGGVDDPAGVAAVFDSLEPSDAPAPARARPAAEPLEVAAEGFANRHVAAPFVVAAIPAPRWGEGGFLPFLIGMEAIRVRAGRVLGTIRGGELRAEFPPVFWDPLLAQPLAFVERRGTDEDDVARVEQELRSFLAGFRSGGASLDEVRQAMGMLLRRLELPPPQDAAFLRALRTQPVYLHERGRVAILYRLHGWPTDLRHAFQGVKMNHVHQVLRERLDTGRTVLVALKPDGD